MYVVRRWSNSIKILQCYKQYIDESSFSRELIRAAQEACGTNLETKTEMSEEKKDDADSTPVLLMTRERFNSLEAAFLVLLVIAFTATAVWGSLYITSILSSHYYRTQCIMTHNSHLVNAVIRYLINWNNFEMNTINLVRNGFANVSAVSNAASRLDAASFACGIILWNVPLLTLSEYFKVSDDTIRRSSALNYHPMANIAGSTIHHYPSTIVGSLSLMFRPTNIILDFRDDRRWKDNTLPPLKQYHPIIT